MPQGAQDGLSAKHQQVTLAPLPVEKLEKLNCPELQEPQVLPSWAQPGSPASRQFPRGDVPAASGAQGSHPPVTRPSMQALS